MGILVTWLTWAFSISRLSAWDLCETLRADFHRVQIGRNQGEHDGPHTAHHGSFFHVPHLRILKGQGRVELAVGHEAPFHPMTMVDDKNEVHFITHLYLLDQDNKIAAFTAMDPSVRRVGWHHRPMHVFDIPKGVTHLYPYSKCNRHGLWHHDGIPVPQHEANGKSFYCNISHLNHREKVWGTIVADLERTQLWFPHYRDNPFNSTDEGAHLHVPYVHVDSQNWATVVVGQGGNLHPMIASTNSSAVHWITHIYVIDDVGEIVALEALDPTMQRATISFQVKARTQGLIPFAHCNLHGLWKGPALHLKLNQHFEL